MSNTKINKNTVPEDFTLSLALVDALPVLFFGAIMIVISLLFKSILFLLGAVLCFYAGAAKVIWKIIVAIKKKNIWWLFMQLRIVMPIGFLMMIIAVIIEKDKINIHKLGNAFISFPSIIFFIIGIIGIILMTIFAIKLDSSDSKANWIEQLTNGIAQCAIFIGLLLLL